MLDSTHPDAILAVEQSVDLAKTVFIVSSKSGGTIETLSHYRYFKAKAKPEQFIVVTDPGSPLAALAERDGLRRTFLNPSDIGGRYSVLSYFGLVPAALAGVPVDELLKSAQIGEQACAHFNAADGQLGPLAGATIGELALRGRDKLTFIVSEPIDSFGLWVEQLVAESTGKHGKGILPVADEPLGDPSVYGDDRVFVYLRNGASPNEELDAAVDALTDAGHPTLTLTTGDGTDLGRLFFIAEYAVAVAGWALEINPFDQPNVQEAKDNTNKVLESGSLPTIERADDAALKALLDVEPPHYVAILGYLPTAGPENAGIDDAISELRAAIRAATGMATTWGYGPRFQHSTGQEHNGGAPNGRFLQLVNVPNGAAADPGRALRLHDADRRRVGRQPADAALARAGGRASRARGRPRAQAIRSLTARIKGLLKAELADVSAVDIDLETAGNPLVDGPRAPAGALDGARRSSGRWGTSRAASCCPAIYNLAHEGALPERIALIGISRGKMTDEEFRARARESIDRFSRRRPDPDVLEGLLDEHPVRLRARSTTRISTTRLQEALGGDRCGLRHAAQPHLLPVDGAGVLPGDHRPARRGRPERGRGRRGPGRDREADRLRPGLGAGAERGGARVLRRVAGLPHRPLPGQGDGPEPDGAALRQRAVRAGLEPQLHRQRPDHRRRGHRRRHARRLLRGRGRAPRPGPEPHAAAARAADDGTADGVRGQPPARREGQGARGDRAAGAGRGRGDGGARAVRRRASCPGRSRSATARSPASPPTPAPRRTPRCACTSTTGAGRASRSTCAPASAWRAS